MSEHLDALKRELVALNGEYDAIVRKRSEWMDAHMADFAKYPIGTVLYSRADGTRLGRVTGYYRYWADERRPDMDCHMSIHYTIEGGDNSSRLSGFVESATERANRLRCEADWLDAQ
jgi:hypothetical protein